MRTMTRELAFLLSVLVTRVAGEVPCMVGAYVDSPIVQAKFLLFDKYINYRARFGDRAYLSEGLQCLEGGRNYKPGIHYAVLDGINATDCPSNAPVFPATLPQHHDRCSPAAYERDPWACAPGDWSGKFGPMDLGLTPIVNKIYESQRFLQQESRTLGESLLVTREEIASHADRMAVPPCAYAGKTIGIFCADGRLAGCGDIHIVKRGAPKDLMEAGFAYFVPIPSPTEGSIVKTVGERDTTSDEQGEERRGWRETISKEVSKMPDYVSGWWEDVKRKSSGAWSSRG